MSTKKATKRALLTSVLAIVLCLVMLIGSTFAWFTDTASTGVNKIQAGNLDVQLLMRGEKGYENIGDSKQAIFGNENSLVAQNDNQNTLWEPGKTQVAYLAIKNNGNLDLKYQVQLKVTNPADGKNLYEVMKYAIVAGSETSTVDGWNAADGKSVVAGAQVVSGTDTTAPTDPTGVKLLHGETHYFALLVHMDENAGNTYMNGKVEFDLTVLAAQLNSESDSFNNEYDKNAPYPTLPTSVGTQDDLAAAIDEGKTNLKLAEGTYTLPSLENKDITISGTKDTVIDMKDTVNKATSVNFDGVTVNYGTENYKGFIHTGKVVFKNCDINGFMTTYCDMTFENCTLTSGNNQYAINFYGGENFVLTNCHFYGVNKNVYVYQEVADSNKNVTFNNCDFHMTAANDTKSAVMLNSANNFNGYSYNVTLTGCTQNGCNATAAENAAGNTNYQGLYGLKHIDGNGSAAIVKGTVTVDGAVAYSNP